MKILIIPSAMLPWPPVKGGAVQNLMRFYADWNEDVGDELTVCSVYNREAEKEAKKYKHTTVLFAKIPQKLFELRDRKGGIIGRVAAKLIYILYNRKVNEVIKGSEFDLVVFENCPVIIENIKVPASTKKILHLHNDFAAMVPRNREAIIRSMDCIITVSDYIRDQVIAIDDGCKKVVTIHNGIELSRFQKKDIARQDEIKDKLGIRQDDIVIIFSARLVDDKGAKELVEAFVSMETTKPCKLLVLGSKVYGKDVADPYYEELLEIASKRKDDIKFLGYVPYDDVPLYLGISDIGVLPSKWEDPFPLTVIEYMAAGLAVVVTNSGGIPEMVGDCGIVVNKDDGLVDNLREALEKVVADGEIRQKNMKIRAKDQSCHFDHRIYSENIHHCAEGLMKD